MYARVIHGRWPFSVTREWPFCMVCCAILYVAHLYGLSIVIFSCRSIMIYNMVPGAQLDHGDSPSWDPLFEARGIPLEALVEFICGSKLTSEGLEVESSV